MGGYAICDTMVRTTLMRQSHRRDMAVFLDMVHNHWDSDSSLWQFDGWTPGAGYGGLYFYNTESHDTTGDLNVGQRLPYAAAGVPTHGDMSAIDALSELYP